MRLFAAIAGILFLPLLASLAVAAMPGSAEVPGLQEIPLRLGINKIDLNHDGEMDRIVAARRENFNAHGYAVYLFMISNKTAQASEPDWLLTPLEEKGKPFVDQVSTVEGADCRLRSVKVFRDKGDDGILVVIAERPLGSDYADRQPVDVQIFGLRRNQSEIPGTPPFYFAEEHRALSKAPYCDADDALAKEPQLLQVIR